MPLFRITSTCYMFRVTKAGFLTSPFRPLKTIQGYLFYVLYISGTAISHLVNDFLTGKFPFCRQCKHMIVQRETFTLF